MELCPGFLHERKTGHQLLVVHWQNDRADSRDDRVHGREDARDQGKLQWVRGSGEAVCSLLRGVPGTPEGRDWNTRRDGGNGRLGSWRNCDDDRGRMLLDVG